MYRRVGREVLLRDAERERERDEALLGAVVDVSLHAAALAVACLDYPRPRCFHLAKPCAKLRLELGVLEAESGGCTGGFEERRIIANTGVVEKEGKRLPVLAGQARNRSSGSILLGFER